MNFIEYASIIVSTISLIVSVLAWNRTRVIYEVRIVDNRQGEERLNQLLREGEYTILSIQPDPLNPFRKFYTLGRIPNPLRVLGLEFFLKIRR